MLRGLRAAVAGGELYVISRSSRRIARLAADVAPSDELVAVAASPRRELARDNVFGLEPLA